MFKGGKGRFCFVCIFFFCVCFGVDFGGGGRVRTRNTLHIVGARKSSICYNAVEGREDDKKENEENSRYYKM